MKLASTVPPISLVSSNLPVFASSGNPLLARDSIATTFWEGSAPGWLAYDISALSKQTKQQVLFVWTNEPTTATYDRVLTSSAHNRIKIPKNYTIEANNSPSGAVPPAAGWVVLETVTGNTLNSYQHLVDLTNYNWVRINISSVSDDSGATTAVINMDLYNAQSDPVDDWIFLGDSITQILLSNTTIPALVNAKLPTNKPVVQNGGAQGLQSSNVLGKFSNWLAVFPGKYVIIAYGTNDALAAVDAASYLTNIENMVVQVIAAGKIPIVPKIPWGPSTVIQSNAPLLNAKIDELYIKYPQVIKGPDFWNALQNKPELFADTVHPNNQGISFMRQSWADTMIANVYSDIIIGDINNSGKVDIFDYNILLSNFGKSGVGYSGGDIDNSGKVGILDYNQLLFNFGKSVP